MPAGLLAQIGDSADGRFTAFEGAVLFIDVEGYSTLTERLTAAGPEGVEELGRRLNRTFGAILGAVREHGGRVALFAGDALLAYWDGPVDETWRPALACARRLATAPLPGADDGWRPRLRQGVGLGACWAALVGPSDGPELILGGPAVAQAFAARRLAAPGRVVLASADALPVLGTSVGAGFVELQRDVDWKGGPTPEDDPGRHAGLVPGMVPLAVTRSLEHGSLDWIGSRRQVHPVFLRFGGLELSADSTGAIGHRLDALAHRLRAGIRPLVGRAGQLVFDDNGLVFLCAPGLPGLSGARDAELALNVLQAAAEVAREGGLSPAGGVASGTPFSRVVGDDWRRAYVTIGAPMNLAARLMALGPGLRTTDEVAGRVEQFELGPPSSRELKGLREPVTVRPLLRARQVDAFVGREPQLVRILEAAGAGRRGRGRALLLEADAGLGKSTLLEVACRRARDLHVPVVRAGAGIQEGAAAYAGVRALLCRALGRPERATPDELTEALRSVLARDPDRLELAPLVATALPIRLAETPLTRTLRGQDRAEASLALLLSLVVDATPAGALVVVEDVHWIDSASVRLLGQLRRRRPDLSLLLTARPMSAGATRLDDGLGAVERLRLEPLGDPEVVALAEAALEGPVDEELGATLVRASAGSPLLVREILLDLRRDDALRRRDGRWVLRPDVAPAPPRSARALLGSRIDALSALAQLTIKTAAAIGSDVEPQLLHRVLPSEVSVDELDAELEDLRLGQLLVRRADGVLRFDHALVRDAAYEQLLYEQRRTLHRTIALALEDEDEEEQVPAELLRHWEAAGDLERALPWADLAADRAAQAGAWAEAVRLLDRCVELAEDRADATTVQRIRWHRKLSEAHGYLGHTGERREFADRALRLSEVALGRTVTRVPLLVSRHVLEARLAAARPEPDPALRARHVELARAFGQAAVVRYFDGDAVGLLTYTLEAIDHAARAELKADLIRRLAELGGALGIGGLHRFGVRMLERAIQLGDQSDDEGSLAYAHMVRALYLTGIADWTVVADSLETSQRIAERIELYVDWGNAQMIAVWMRFYRGQWEEARRRAERFLVRAREAGNEQHESWATRALGVLAMQQGDVARAAGLLEASLAVPERARAHGEIFESLGSLCRALMLDGQGERALEVGTRAARLAREMRRPTSHAVSIAAGHLCAACLDARRRGANLRAWQRVEKEAFALMGRVARAFPVAAPVARGLRAARLAQRGRRAAARSAAERARRSAARAGVTLAWALDEG